MVLTIARRAAIQVLVSISPAPMACILRVNRAAGAAVHNVGRGIHMGFLRARLLVAGVVIALSVAAVEPASAKVITLNATLDLDKALYSVHGFLAGEYYGWGAALPLSAPFD